MTSVLSTAIFIAIVVIAVQAYQSVSSSNKIDFFSIPKPKVEVFTHSGFRISIEDEPGITVFEIHASINKELDWKSGSYIRDARTSHNGRWTVEFKDIRLYVGDVIFYRIFVTNEKLKYQLDRQYYIVKELTQQPPSYTTEPTFVVDQQTDTPSKKSTASDSSKYLQVCTETVLNTTEALLNTRNQLEELQKLNKLLISTLDKYPGSKEITLSGRLPSKGSSILIVQFILKEKFDLNFRVLNAHKVHDGTIVFEVSSLAEKFKILLLSEQKLKDSNFNFS